MTDTDSKVVYLDCYSGDGNAIVLDEVLVDEEMGLEDISDQSVEGIRSQVENAIAVVLEVIDGSGQIYPKAKEALQACSDEAIPFVIWTTRDESHVTRVLEEAGFEFSGLEVVRKVGSVFQVVDAVKRVITASGEFTLRMKGYGAE